MTLVTTTYGGTGISEGGDKLFDTGGNFQTSSGDSAPKLQIYVACHGRTCPERYAQGAHPGDTEFTKCTS